MFDYFVLRNGKVTALLRIAHREPGVAPYARFDAALGVFVDDVDAGAPVFGGDAEWIAESEVPAIKEALVKSRIAR